MAIDIGNKSQDMSQVRVALSGSTVTTDFGGGTLFQKTGLADKTIPQSMAFDYLGQAMTPAGFIAQVKSAVNGDGGRQAGELYINRISASGSITSNMKLLHSHVDKTVKESDGIYYEKSPAVGFGHGTQIGYEYDSNGSKWIWVEINSRVADASKTKEDMNGRQVARVKYSAGGTVKPHSDGVQWLHWNKLWKNGERSTSSADYKDVTVSVDNVNKLLCLKYNYDGTMKLSMFKMKYNSSYKSDPTMDNIVFTHLGTFNVPRLKWWGATSTGKADSSNVKQLTPNGWAIFGEYVYLGYGTAYFNTDTTKGQNIFFSPTPAQVKAGIKDGNGKTVTKCGNTHLRCFRWTTATGTTLDESEVYSSHSEAGKSLVHRELEGLSIIPRTTRGTGNANSNEESTVTSLELVFCFAGGEQGNRNFSFFSKKNKVPV